jgi:hypothetical protein
MYMLIDIGGTNMRVASAREINDSSIGVIKKAKTTNNFEVDFKVLCDLINEVSNGLPITALSIGIKGDLDVTNSVIYDVYHITDWNKRNLKEKLQNKYNCKVIIENDAVAAAAYVSKNSSSKDFLYITWGTGIGGVLVQQDGKYKRLISIEWNRILEEWEEKCGGRMLRKKFAKEPEELTEEDWKILLDDFYIELKKLSSLYLQPRIILGGGIVDKNQDTIQRYFDLTEDLEVTLSPSDDDLGLFGALELVRLYQN